mgnify:FL=1
MKTLFEALNKNDRNIVIPPKDDTQYLIFIRDRVNKYLRNELLSNIALDMNKVNPKLKMFFGNNYSSPILKVLYKEGIDLAYLDEIKSDIYIDNNSSEFKKFVNVIHDAETICINEIIEESFRMIKSKYKENYNKEAHQRVKDYIYSENEYINFLSHIYVDFLNKDKKTGEYIISRLNYDIDKNNDYSMRIYRVVYDVKNENNKFNIKNGDPVAKEYVIEYTKESISKEFINFNKTPLYSGYFDYL